MTGDSLFIVMGVSGSGKSTVGRLLARATGGDCLDADDFHTPEAKARMHAGIPMTDDDRWPWLDRLNAALRDRASQAGRPSPTASVSSTAPVSQAAPAFLACSALKQSHRDRLGAGLLKVYLSQRSPKGLGLSRVLTRARPAGVGLEGLEPPFLAEPEPKSGASANFATSPNVLSVASLRFLPQLGKAAWTTRYDFEFPLDAADYDRALRPLGPFINPQGETARRLDAQLVEILIARGDLPSEEETRQRRRDQLYNDFEMGPRVYSYGA
jgi:carbohydrate kinase (thermoresistant glucokinase family)